MKVIFILAIIAVVFAEIKFTGVNLAGLEFGSNIPGTVGTDYFLPNNGEVDYFVKKGLNMFRLPFLWERLQRSLNGPLDTNELNRIKGFVSYAKSKGAFTLLDPHNYARYGGVVIGTGNVPTSAFADFWSKLATEFKNDDHVIFGIMNEPNGMTTELWLTDANAAIAAIRSAGANNLLFVPGNGFTGAHSWLSNFYGTPNAQVMLGVVDPKNNFVIEVHQYLDSDSSGTHTDCIDTTIGSTRMAAFTKWLRDNGKKGFLGEIGGGRDATCVAAIDDILGFVNKNSDVYVGWTYWAGGPAWGDYFTTLEPDNTGADRPQMASVTKNAIVNLPSSKTASSGSLLLPSLGLIAVVLNLLL